MRNERMVKAIAENRSRDMWSEVKKANGKRSSPPNIDGVSDPKDIADLFRNKYENLYNCNPPDKYNMVKIGEYIEKGILSSDRDDYTANRGTSSRRSHDSRKGNLTVIKMFSLITS